MFNGRKLVRRLRGGSGGIPWMVMLNADGEELITSDGPGGNIGFPTDSSKIDYFIEMLRVARPQMSADNAGAIHDALARYKQGA